jgi:hypothetical protein
LSWIERSEGGGEEKEEVEEGVRRADISKMKERDVPKGLYGLVVKVPAW